MTKENEMWVIEQYYRSDGWLYTEHGCYYSIRGAQEKLKHIKKSAFYVFNKPKYRIAKWVRKEVRS